jgi:hypothetical protein
MEMLSRFDAAFLQNYVNMMARFGTTDVYDVKPEDIKPWAQVPKMLPIPDGMSFDLGGRIVDTVFTPGHTPGGVSFIDHGSRILFSGDACNPNLGLQSCPISMALEGLLRLKARKSEFDRNYNGHIGYGGDVSCYSLGDYVLEDCIGICQDIIAGTADVQTADTGGIFGKQTFVQRAGHNVSYQPFGGAVRISFDPAKV